MLSFSSSSLRPLDVEFMRHLSKVVNIVPVIAKADTLTLEERDSFKKTVREVCLHALLGLGNCIVLAVCETWPAGALQSVLKINKCSALVDRTTECVHEHRCVQ